MSSTTHTPTASIGEQLRETATVWSRGQHELVLLSVRLADSDEWLVDGAPTPAHWIAAVADIEVSTAREWIRIGRALQELPATADAFARSALSYSKVRALTRIATPQTEAELIDLAMGVPSGQLPRALAAWVRKNTHPDELADHHRRRRWLKFRTEPDGMVSFAASLPPMLAATFVQALDEIVLRSRPRRENPEDDVAKHRPAAGRCARGATRRGPRQHRSRDHHPCARRRCGLR